MVFLVFRQQNQTIQALVQVEPELVSKKMVRFAESINPESIVLVEGTVQKPLELVKSCTVQDAEIKIKTVSFEAPSGDASRANTDALHGALDHSFALSLRRLPSFPSPWPMLSVPPTRL